MAKWFKTLWAASGDKTAVPDALDVSGAVSYTEGYNLNYERVLGTDPLARAIERQKLNYVLSDVTGALQQYQTKGFPDYIDAATNGGTAYAYAINAVVRFTDDKNYLNTVAGNTNAPNVSGWVLHNDIASTVHAATSKTTPADADEFGLVDSADSNVLKKLTWANLKSAIGTYIGLTYAPIASPVFTGNPTAPTPSVGDNDTSIATTAFVTLKSELDSIGVNQTWQDMTLSRALNATYTNITGKPIQVYVRCLNGASIRLFTVDGIEVGYITNADSGRHEIVSFIVPNNSIYGTGTGGATLTKWMELR